MSEIVQVKRRDKAFWRVEVAGEHIITTSSRPHAEEIARCCQRVVDLFLPATARLVAEERQGKEAAETAMKAMAKRLEE